jgi:hypothetical protein
MAMFGGGMSERLAFVLSVEGVSGAVRDFKRVGTAAEQELGRADAPVARLRGRFNQAATAALQFAGQATAVGAALFGAGRAVTEFTREASRLQQAVGATEGVFGEAAAQIDEFAARSVVAAGLSEAAYRELAARIGGSLQNMGFSVQEAAETTDLLIQRGADLAARFGGDTAAAVDALAAALRGEADPAEQFALRLNAAAVNARAVEMGLAASTSRVDDYARAQATVALALDQSADAAGTFAREQDTLAGAQQRAQAQWEDAKATLGDELLPIVTDLTRGFAQLAQVVSGDEGAWETGLMDPDTADEFADGWFGAFVGIETQARKTFGEFTAGADRAAEAARRHAEQIDTQHAALLGLSDTLRAQTDPMFAVITAQEGLAEAQARLAEAQASGTATADELAAAQTDVGRAASGLEGALLDLVVGIETGNVDLNTAVSRLHAWRDSGLITAATATDLETRFRNAAAQSQIQGRATMDASQAIAEVDRLLGAIQRAGTARAASAQMALTILGSQRQHGGPVTAGHALFVPAVSGRIEPSVPSEKGGGNTYHVTVNVAPMASTIDAGRQIVEAIRAYERSNSSAWR